jgi:hypothetical protein
LANEYVGDVTISSDADAANHQQDLDKLAEWEYKWHMKFHPEKCIKSFGKIHYETVCLFSLV